MSLSKNNNEAQFINWLSKRVSPGQLSELYMALQEIEQQAKKARIVGRSLYENLDMATCKKIRSNIEQSRVFKFTHKRQMGWINSSLNYMMLYEQELLTQEEVKVKALEIVQEKMPIENKQENIEDFYQWLRNDQHMAEGTCRGYISAVKGAEKYASEHSFKNVRLFAATTEEAKRTADELFCNQEFLDKDKTQSNRFRSAIIPFSTLG